MSVAGFTKPRLTALVLGVLVFVGSSANGLPRDDAALIAGRLISQEFEASMAANTVKTYATALTGALSKHSVQVATPDRLHALLANYIAKKRRVDLLAATEALLLEGFDPEQLGLIADYLRRNPDCPCNTNEQLAPVHSVEEMTTQIEGATQALESDDSKAALLLVPVMLGVISYNMQSTRQMDLDLSDPDLIEIFETPGVLRFPNLIFKRDFIRDLRAAES